MWHLSASTVVIKECAAYFDPVGSSWNSRSQPK